jgi:hypothetical protein
MLYQAAAEPKAQRMSFKTISYLLGNLTQMASSLYKPVQRSQEHEGVSTQNHEFGALKGSSKVTSTSKIGVAIQRRYTEDHFEENQDVTESSDEENLTPVVEHEGSSTSDDSKDSSIEAVLTET